MNIVTKCICTSLIAFGISFATEEDSKQLEVHAKECLDYLEAFTNPEFNPKKSIQKSYENGSLVLRYKDEVITQTDLIAEKWAKDCSDIFVSDKYAPGFFKESPVHKVISDRIKHKSFAERIADQNTASNTTNNNGLFTLRATFQNGFLKDIDVITPYTTPFQYKYGGENIIWGKFDDKNVFASALSAGSFTYSFSQSGDSIRYTSPLKTYTIEKSGAKSWGNRIASPKTWEVKAASEDVLNGNITYEKDLFTAVPRGNIDHSWAIKGAASIGLHAFAYTDDMIKDNKWVEDSTKYMGGVGTLGFLIDITAGVVHCSPATGRCFGFGAGYARNAFDGFVVDEEVDWYHNKSIKNKFKYIDNLNFYGEYYLNGKSPKGFRESIAIPLNASMKYLTSKTGFFLGSWRRFEFGLEFSPIQYIPGIYIQYGLSFSTPALW